MTFSISARCAHTGMLGVAVSTAVPAVSTIARQPIEPTVQLARNLRKSHPVQ